MNDQPTKKTYQINNYLSVKLIGTKTYIFVNNKCFRKCASLVLTIPLDRAEAFEDVRSIDEAASVHKTLYENYIYEDQIASPLSAETEFWGHCSNLEAWAEHDYDTRLLHSNLSFPLLEKLVISGDPVAHRVFKDEIAQRFEEGVFNTLVILTIGEYLKFLNGEERGSLIRIAKDQLVSFLSSCLSSRQYFDIGFLLLSQLNYPRLFKREVREQFLQIDKMCCLEKLAAFVRNLEICDPDLKTPLRLRKEQVFEILIRETHSYLFGNDKRAYDCLGMIFDTCFALLKDIIGPKYLSLDKSVIRCLFSQYYSHFDLFLEADFDSTIPVYKAYYTNENSPMYLDYTRQFYSNPSFTANFFEASHIIFSDSKHLISHLYQSRENEDELLCEYMDFSQLSIPIPIRKLIYHLYTLACFSENSYCAPYLLKKFISKISSVKDFPTALFSLFTLITAFYLNKYRLLYVSEDDFEDKLEHYFERQGFDFDYVFSGPSYYLTEFKCKRHGERKWKLLLTAQHDQEKKGLNDRIVWKILTHVFFPNLPCSIIEVSYRQGGIEFLLRNNTIHNWKFT